MMILKLLLLSTCAFATDHKIMPGQKIKPVFMSDFLENDTVVLQTGDCGGKSVSPIKVMDMHGKSCSIPGNARLKVISRRIEPVKDAGTVGEENGVLLQLGMEYYVFEYKNLKNSCRFEVNDMGSGFAKFSPHQKNAAIDACIVNVKEVEANKAPEKPDSGTSDSATEK